MSAYPRPFDPADFRVIPAMTAPESKEVAKELSAKAPMYARSALRVPGKPDAYITKLWIQDPRGTRPSSQSFQNKDPGSNAAIDAANHFNFIPGLDAVEVRWTVVKPNLLVRALFEVWAFGIPGAPIWSKEVRAPAAQQLIGGEDGSGSGSLPWSDVTIAGDAARFPDGVPNVASAPYQMRLTVESAGGMITTAWTYFDVLIHSIELRWGGQALVPPGDIQDVLPDYRPLTARDERDLVNGLYTGAAIDPTVEVEIALRSTNAAYVHLQEWYTWRDLAFLRYKARWGAGPRIPIVAKIALKDIDGNAKETVAAKRALGPARFLWDWKDKTEAQRRGDLAACTAQALTFVIAGLKYKENAASDPPDCLNAHEERGGKRGGASRVLPTYNNAANFPFTVAPGATRTWASISDAATAGPYKGQTGIVFQPSRMALDSYQLRVFLASGGHMATLDAAGTMQNLILTHPGLPTAETGMVNILRRVDARYVRKSNDTPAMDLIAITNEYALGGIKIIWTNQYWGEAQYKQLLANAMAPDNAGESNAHARGSIYQKNARGRRLGLTTWTTNTLTGTVPSVVRAKLGGFDQWFGCPAGQVMPSASTAQFTLPGRDLVEEPFISAVVKEYIEKDRKINSQKRVWGKFKARNAGTADDRLRVRFYNEILSDDQRTKIEPEIRRRIAAAGWLGWNLPRDSPAEWAEMNYSYRISKLVYLSDEMHVRKVLADAFEGVTFFHYQHFFDTLKADGTSYARQCSIGGVAAISMISDLGLSGAFTVWDHPTFPQRQTLARQVCVNRGTRPSGPDGHTGGSHGDCTFKDGISTAVHEFGHFLHLPHATPTGGDLEAAMHDQGDLKCIMNYDFDALRLCGGCLLRLRGWGFFKRGPIEGFSNTTPNLVGAPPPPCPDDRVEAELTNFYTQWA